MSLLKHADSTRLTTRIVGYFDHRSGQFICLRHGARDIESPRSPWAAVQLLERLQSRDASTTAVICDECGAWLNDESTGYAIVAPHHDYWRRQLRFPRPRHG
jgi:hypothetical protein